MPHLIPAQFISPPLSFSPTSLSLCLFLSMSLCLSFSHSHTSLPIPPPFPRPWANSSTQMLVEVKLSILNSSSLEMTSSLYLVRVLNFYSFLSFSLSFESLTIVVIVCASLNVVSLFLTSATKASFCQSGSTSKGQLEGVMTVWQRFVCWRAVNGTLLIVLSHPTFAFSTTFSPILTSVYLFFSP